MKFEDGSKMQKKLQVGRLPHIFLETLILSQALEPSLRENDSAFGKSIIYGMNLLFREFFWKIGTWEGFQKNARFMTSPSFFGTLLSAKLVCC